MNDGTRWSVARTDFFSFYISFWYYWLRHLGISFVGLLCVRPFDRNGLIVMSGARVWVSVFSFIYYFHMSDHFVHRTRCRMQMHRRKSLFRFVSQYQRESQSNKMKNKCSAVMKKNHGNNSHRYFMWIYLARLFRLPGQWINNICVQRPCVCRWSTAHHESFVSVSHLIVEKCCGCCRSWYMCKENEY